MTRGTCRKEGNWKKGGMKGRIEDWMEEGKLRGGKESRVGKREKGQA